MSKVKQPLFQVRHSRIEGMGAFATQRIRKGTRIIEYLGERITPEEGDLRYEREDDGPVLLFLVDDKIAIDAGVGGNDARFINHSCDPNCEVEIERRRVFIDAIRTIQPGEELTYDYSLTREEGDDEKTEKEFACHCGAANCRGTMLEPLEDSKPPKKRKTKKRKAK